MTVRKLAGDLHIDYNETRQKPQTQQWPPNQPSSIVSVALIHYKNSRTQQELIEISKRFREGAPAVDKLLSHSRVTKNITKIFTANPADEMITDNSSSIPPKRILIEGAPGIGKTVLAKEIAYFWANGDLLTEFKLLFLVYLRDPKVHDVKSVKDILQLFLFQQVPSDLEDYVKECRGKNIAFVFDGFDEYPVPLQRNSFIMDIIECKNEGKMFQQSTVVVTSRPLATLFLHHIVDRRIEILGFAKEERDKYISLSLKDSPDSKQELNKFLKQNPIIDGLCYVPLHLAILLFLFQNDSLPETLTEMNELFVIHTIYRHLNKLTHFNECVVKKLAEMPKAIYVFVLKLSGLAFEGIQKNKLVFSYDEIREVCPEVDTVDGAINGFGLLQAVQHYVQKGAGRTTSFNFLHFTMQEYLAALHVSTLHSWQQSSLLKETFWDGLFSFMWMMYVGIVGIRSDAFASFVSTYGDTFEHHRGLDQVVSCDIQNDKRKCLHLFQCYMEAKSQIPETVSSCFSDGNITLAGITLLPHHISSLVYFMSTSITQQWRTLNLGDCNLRNIGMNCLLEHVIKDTEKISTLEYVDLSGNDSSPWGVYCIIIKHCCVDSLTLWGDDGMAEYIREIKIGLESNSRLKSLKLCSIDNDGAKCLAEAIWFNTSLQKLDISWNGISNDGVIALSDSLKNNHTLKELDLSVNKINRSGMDHLLASLRMLEYVDLSGNDSSPWGVYCDIIRHCCVDSLALCGDYKMDEYVKEISDNLEINRRLQSLTLCSIGSIGLSVFQKIIVSNTTLKKVNLSWKKINSDRIKNNTSVILCTTLTHQKLDHRIESDSNCTTVEINILYDDVLEFSSQTINLSGQKICDVATQFIAFGLCDKMSVQGYNVAEGRSMISFLKNRTLKEIDLSVNCITTSGMLYLMEFVNTTSTLEYVDLSGNYSSPWGVYCVIIRHCCVNSLTLCGDGGMVAYAEKITDNLEINRRLQSLTLCSIGIIGLSIFQEIIVSNTTLKKVNLSWKKINSDRIKNNTSVILCTTLTHQKLDPRKEGDSNCTTVEINILYDDVLEFSSQTINLSGQKICDVATQFIAFGLCDKMSVQGYNVAEGRSMINCLRNRTLKEIDLSVNCITTSGMFYLIESIKYTSLEYVDLSGNFSSPWGMYCAIIRHCCVNSLTLCGDDGMDKCVKVIADSLEANKTLESLTLCSIGRIGLKTIKNILATSRTLNSVNMSWEKLSYKEIHNKDNVLLNFNLSVNKLDKKTVFVDNNKVVYFGILYDDSQVQCLPKTTDGMAALLAFGLCYYDTQQRLDISCSEIFEDFDDSAVITATIIEFLKKKSTVLKLILSLRSDSDYPLERIVLSDKSEICNMSRKMISDAGTLVVSAMLYNKTNVVVLNLSENRISDVGVVAISECLKNNNIIQELNLSFNEITDIGVLVIAEALLINSALRKLDISSNKVSDDGVAAISDCLRNNSSLHELSLANNKFSNNAGFKIAKMIEVTSTLYMLDISMNRTYKTGIRSICQSLKKNSTLQRLLVSLPYSSTVLDVYAEGSACNLAFKDIGDDGALIVSALLHNIPNVITLNLSHNRISEAGVKAINEYLKNSKVQDLDLSYNSITNTELGASMIAEAICANVVLKKLDISGNDISETGIHIIGESLKTNTELLQLVMPLPNNHPAMCIDGKVRLCNMSKKGVGDCGALILSGLLYWNAYVKVLNVSQNGISDIGAIAISNCIKNNTSLQEVTMSHNHIAIKGAEKIAEAIQFTTTLQKLDISYCCIPVDGALVISESCKNNKTLQELIISWKNDQVTVSTADPFWNLSRKNIGNTGASIVSNLLFSNTKVKKLDVSYNDIGGDGLTAISHFLRNDRSMEELNMIGNIISADESETLFTAVQFNPLLKLKLHD